MGHFMWSLIAEKFAERINQLESESDSPQNYESFDNAESAGIEWAWNTLVKEGAIPSDMKDELMNRLKASLDNGEDDEDAEQTDSVIDNSSCPENIKELLIELAGLWKESFSEEDCAVNVDSYACVEWDSKAGIIYTPAMDPTVTHDDEHDPDSIGGHFPWEHFVITEADLRQMISQVGYIPPLIARSDVEIGEE